MDVYIYTLENPITGDIRYVGKTINPKKRLYEHLTDGKSSPRKSNWLKSLAKIELKPRMEILEVIKNSNDLDWQVVESFWISYLRYLGFELTNLESGGRSGKFASAETRLKMSLARKGKKRPLCIGAKISATKKGVLHSAEAKNKMSASQRRRVRTYSDETRRLLSAAKKGKKVSPQGRINMSNAGKGHCVSVEARLKMSASHTGMKQSTATVEKRLATRRKNRELNHV